MKIEASDVISVIGLFLTLVGLLSTFFYMHLGDWYSSILELHSIADENAKGDDDRRKNARTECRYKYQRFNNYIELMITLSITLFIIFVMVLSWKLMRLDSPESMIYTYFKWVFLIFLIIYIAFTSFFLVSGYKKLKAIKKLLNI